MKRAALVAACVVALVAMALLWRSRPAASSDAPRSEPSVQTESDDSTTVLSDDHELESARSTPQPQAIASAQATPSAAATASPRGLEVVVVDAGSRMPVPDADVYLLEVPESDRERSDLWRRLHATIPAIEAGGKHHLTNDVGRVELPATATLRWIYGRFGDQRGILRIGEQNKGPVWLELHADFDVTVQVVDEVGVPVAGVPVALAFGNDRTMREGEIAVSEGANAIATLHHVGLALGINTNDSGFAALAGLFDPPICAALDKYDPPKAPVVLQAPSSGSLEIIARHADGSPDLDSTGVRVHFIRSNPDPLDERTSNVWIGDMQQGRAVVPRVALGCRVHVDAYRNGQGMPVRSEADGPTQPGERAVVTIDVDAFDGERVLTARFFDEQGHSIASKQVLFALLTAEQQSPKRLLGTTTDREGRVRFPLGDDASDPPPTHAIFASQTTRPVSQYELFARVPLPSGLSPEVTNLGDVVLGRGPLLVRGRVLDEERVPVPGARVALAHEGKFTGFWPSWVRTQSDSDGRFEVHGLCSAERLFVTADVDGRRSQRAPFEVGAESIELIVERTGAIAGTIRRPVVLDSRDVFVQAKREDLAGAGTLGATIDLEGGFAFRDLSVGTYRVKVLVAQEEAELANIEGVRVEGGATVRPPKLDPLDLTGRVHLHEITARDREGKLLSSLEATWRAVGAIPEDDDHGKYFPNGRVRIVSVHPRVDATVTAQRMRASYVEDLAGAREIVMLPHIRVELVLHPDSMLPDEPFKLSPSLAPTAQSHDRDGWHAEPFSPQRETYVSARDVGPREVRFTLYKGDSWVPEAEIRPAPPQLVTILEEPAEQTITVTISEADLRRAMAAYPP